MSIDYFVLTIVIRIEISGNYPAINIENLPLLALFENINSWIKKHHAVFFAERR